MTYDMQPNYEKLKMLENLIIKISMIFINFPNFPGVENLEV